MRDASHDRSGYVAMVEGALSRRRLSMIGSCGVYSLT